MKRRLLLSATLAFISTVSFAQQRALNFDGTDDYVTSAYPGITGSNARTIEAMIRTTANCNPNTGGIQNTIVDWGDMNNGQRFTFNLLWANSVRIEIGGSGISGSTPVNDGQWHHIAVTYSGSPTTGNTKLYIDGTLEATGTLSGVNTSSLTPVTIGRRVSQNNYFDGDIDEVRVWNAALSATDIQSRASDEMCIPPATCVLYYKFNQGTVGGNNAGQTTAFDAIANNNGTLSNFSMNGANSNWIAGSSSLSLGGAFVNDTVTGCNSATLPSSGIVVTQSGVYNDTLQAADGCDSIISYQVNLTPVDTAVTVNDSVLTATSSADAWQWLDCDNGMMPIAGATSSTFTASANGNYAVVITNGTCSDTSACKTVSGIGMNEWGANELAIYPNPSSDGSLNIELPNGEHVSIRVYSQSGVLIREMESNGSTLLQLNETPGIYHLEIISEQKRSVQKIILL